MILLQSAIKIPPLFLTCTSLVNMHTPEHTFIFFKLKCITKSVLQTQHNIVINDITGFNSGRDERGQEGREREKREERREFCVLPSLCMHRMQTQKNYSQQSNFH